jgi:hypothetical protein
VIQSFRKKPQVEFFLKHPVHGKKPFHIPIHIFPIVYTPLGRGMMYDFYVIEKV